MFSGFVTYDLIRVESDAEKAKRIAEEWFRAAEKKILKNDQRMSGESPKIPKESWKSPLERVRYQLEALVKSAGIRKVNAMQMNCKIIG